MLHIKLVKSPIGNNVRNRATVTALGLRKMHQTVILPDNPSVRGMIHHVKHMLEVKEVAGNEGQKPTSLPRGKRTSAKAAKTAHVAKAITQVTAKAAAAPKEKAASKAEEAPKAEAAPQAEKAVAAKAAPKAAKAAAPKAAAKPAAKKPAAKPAAKKSKEDK
jgi:ribosomal protein L30